MSEIAAGALRNALDRLDMLVDWERSVRAKMRMDLSPIVDLLARLGNPERKIRALHVTGTKGKGSVCALLEAGLAHAGWRVGRYSSPHLERINERISEQMRPIKDEVLTKVLDRSLNVLEEARRDGSAAKDATWFDVITAAGYLFFAEADLDWIVVEVGLGGRLDSTNVIHPDVTIITNVGLEHTDVLGDTVEKIAREKAGIIKPGSVLVTPLSSKDPAGRVVHEVASQLKVPVVVPEVAASASIWEGNLAIARTALEVLGDRDIKSLLRMGRNLGAEDLPDHVANSARLPGRLERFRIRRNLSDKDRINVVIDGAHVDFALRQVLLDLKEDNELVGAPVVLLAMGADKNAELIVSQLVGVASHVVCTEVNSGRPTMTAARLADVASSLGINATAVSSPGQGIVNCLEKVNVGWILVTGSLHLVAAVRPTFLNLRCE